MRRAVVSRSSKETSLKAELTVEGGAAVFVDTGLPFFDHMLEQVARYASFDLVLSGTGDLAVDTHHLVEDAGIVFGQALAEALGDRLGIARFGHAYAPLDEAMARVVVDLGKRPFLVYNLHLDGHIGALDVQVLEEFWKAFTIHSGATVHVDLVRGRNLHHCAESTFKALGLALRQACAVGPGGGVPSSKGLLG